MVPTSVAESLVLNRPLKGRYQVLSLGSVAFVKIDRISVGYSWAKKLMSMEGCLGGHMRKLIAVMLLILGTSTVSMAVPGPTPFPEIDPTTGRTAMALLAGAALIIRDCLAAKLRPGNVHSAEDWDELLLPEIERQQAESKEVAFRADAAFAKPEIYEALEKRA